MWIFATFTVTKPDSLVWKLAHVDTESRVTA